MGKVASQESDVGESIAHPCTQSSTQGNPHTQSNTQGLLAMALQLSTKRLIWLVATLEVIPDRQHKA